MRERIVQIPRDLEAFANDRRVARFFGETLDLARPDGHAALEFAAFLSKIRENLRERAPELRHLIDTAGNLDVRFVLSDLR